MCPMFRLKTLRAVAPVVGLVACGDAAPSTRLGLAAAGGERVSLAATPVEGDPLAATVDDGGLAEADAAPAEKMSAHTDADAARARRALALFLDGAVDQETSPGVLSASALSGITSATLAVDEVPLDDVQPKTLSASLSVFLLAPTSPGADDEACDVLLQGPSVIDGVEGFLSLQAVALPFVGASDESLYYSLRIVDETTSSTIPWDGATATTGDDQAAPPASDADASAPLSLDAGDDGLSAGIDSHDAWPAAIDANGKLPAAFDGNDSLPAALDGNDSLPAALDGNDSLPVALDGNDAWAAAGDANADLTSKLEAIGQKLGLTNLLGDDSQS